MAGTRKAIADFVLMIRELPDDAGNAQRARNWVKTSPDAAGILRDLFKDKTPEGVSRYENIQELLAGMKEFSEANTEGTDLPRTLSDFLIDVALADRCGQHRPERQRPREPDDDPQCEGFGVPLCACGGLEEDLFPNLMSVQSRADLEEERRLFYVAITRAEKSATLSYAMSRYKWGNLTASEPSRFIDEIDPKYLEMPAQNERGAFSSGHYVRPGTPPRARAKVDNPTGTSMPNLDQGQRKNAPHRDRCTDANAAHPVWKAQHRARLPGTHLPPLGTSARTLKRISNAGAPLEATNSLGGGSSDIEEGMTVEHERFGKGKVLKVEGNAPDLKATVFFPSAGQKQLLLRFAKLTVVEG